MRPVSLYDLEAMAKQAMPHNLWDFVEGAAFDEITKHRNRTAFDEITINPSFLVDVNDRDASTTVLGERISFPVMVAPAGGQSQMHPDGELATAQAAGDAGTLYALPTSSGHSIEEVAEVASGPLWFQLYHFSDEVTQILVKRARDAGYKAICLTVDTPSPSPKERDLRNAIGRLPGPLWGSLRDRPDLVESIQAGVPDMADWSPPRYTGLTWTRLDWLRSLTGLPLIVKGIRTASDALLCVEHSVDAIIVSNHGGRQLDGTLSSIETLPAIVDAVDGRLEIYLDSGIRRGLDVLKAIALGARAVLMGRPLFWGLAVDGRRGVRTALEILRTEFDRAMAYCGRTRVGDIDRSLVSLPCRCWGGGR